MAAQQPLGYSLHAKTSELVEEFRKTVNDNFKWLEEILAEAKKHFGRRDNALLPKTPCMKRKRKHTQRNPEEFSDSSMCFSSPITAPETPPDDIRTPESKKLAIRSPLKEVDNTLEDTLDVSVQKNNRKRAAKKAPAKKSKRQQPKRSGRNSKKTVQLEESSVTEPTGQATTPKRVTRSRNKKTSEPVQQEPKNTFPDNESDMTKKKRATRGKRKQSSEVVQEDKVESTVKERDNSNPNILESAKKIRISETDEEITLKDAVVFIPETPEVRAIQNSKTKEDKPVKACKVMTSIVLASPVNFSPNPILSVIQETSEVSVEEPQGNNPVVVEVQPIMQTKAETVDAEALEEEVGVKRRSQESPKLRRSKRLTRSMDVSSKDPRKRMSEESPKMRRSKKVTPSDDDNKIVPDEEQQDIADSFAEDEEYPLVTTSTPVQDDYDEHHDRDDSPAKSANLDPNTVTSTVDLSVKQRSCQSNKRLSAESPQESKRQRKSNNKQKSLVKSSVKLKLAQQLMPPLTPTSSGDDVNSSIEKSDDDNVGSLRVKLFASENDGDKDEDNEVNLVVNKKTMGPQAGHSIPLSVSTSSSDSVEEGDAVGNEEGDEVFHDASDQLDEEDGNCQESQRPQTRASSRCKSEGTCSSSGNEGESGNSPSSSTQDSNDPLSSDKQKHPELPRVKNIVLASSFIKRNTPKKDPKEKNRQLKEALIIRTEKERQRIGQLELERQRKIEAQKSKREERERRVAEQRAAQAREKEEKKKQLEQKDKLISTLTEKAKKKKEKEEDIKRKARLQKKAELDARRKQEEEARKQKYLEQEEETRRHEELIQRKQEFEEQERQRKIVEAKRQQELRELEMERERENENARKVKELEERDRKAREEKEKARDEREKEERERKRIAQLLKEKAERERRERELKARDDKLRQERERRLREEREKALQLQKEEDRKRQLEERLRAEEARKHTMPNADSYEMTPPPPPRVRSVVVGENYNIDDLCSDDSTDDEDDPRKKIPGWAQGSQLKATLLNQELEKIDTYLIFGDVPMPDLSEIFTKQKKKRFFQRTSSAHWGSPPLKALNRGTFV